MLVCSYCHHGNPPDSRFCAQCGTRLVTATERHEERKLVSVLFVDLVGFTSRAERLDVEDVQALLDRYYALVREQAAQHGGTIEKFIGDAVVAIFGVPVAHEDDAERAVRAAFAVLDAIGAANESRPELDLHVRAAVTTGEALVMLDVGPDTGETFASGDIVNTAARLQTAAPVDGVVVGEGTFRATRGAIEYEPGPAVIAKGKAEPVPCWRAVRARSRVGDSRRHRDAVPLVGRRRELAALTDALAGARADRAVRTVTLVGPPGIGKSRLTRELFRRIDSQPELIRWREGRSPPYGRGLAFRALDEIVKAEAGILESHDRGAASVKLREAVEDVIPNAGEAAWVERHLRALVGLDAGAPVGDSRAEAFAAWRRFIERLAEHRASVLVFEDLHWADDALLDFIDHLLAWAAPVPLVVLGTARPELLERRPHWGAGGDGAAVVALGPMTPGETEQLLAALLGDTRLTGETRGVLLARAEGNPLYAQEFVRMLSERGLLVERDGEWVLERTTDIPVPDSVVGIIAARLDAMPARDRTVIQDAAVVGRAFWPGAVASLAGRDRAAVGDAIERLERRHLVRRRHESSVEGDAEYAFEHALVREVAYRSIVRARRAHKHRRTAEWLVSIAGDSRDRADTIAHHYVTALENAEASRQATDELRAAASEALVTAAERADTVHAHASAAALWGRAVELCRAGDPRLPRLLLAHGKALALADEPAGDILSRATSALVAAGDADGAADAESTLGWLASVAGAPSEAQVHDERALALARRGPESRAKAIILTRAAANIMFVGRRDEALQLLAEARAIARATGFREMEAEVGQFVGMARLDAGEADGVRDLESALAVATELNSPAALTCYGNLAEMRRYLGALEASAALNMEGERAAKRFGLPVQVRRFRAGRGCDLYYRGDWEGALAHIGEYLDAVETGSPHRLAGEVRLHRGRIRLARGDVAGATADAAAALEFARTTEEPFDLLPALAFHTRVAAESGAPGGDADELLEAIAAQPFWGAWALPDVLPGIAGDARRAEVRRLLTAARPRTPWYDAVTASLDGDSDRAAEIYAAIGSRPDAAYARLHAADRALANGDREAARRALEPAIAFLRDVGATAHLRHAEALAAALVAPPTPAAAPSPRSAR